MRRIHRNMRIDDQRRHEHGQALAHRSAGRFHRGHSQSESEINRRLLASETHQPQTVHQHDAMGACDARATALVPVDADMAR